MTQESKSYTLIRGDSTIVFTKGPSGMMNMVGIQSERITIPLVRNIGSLKEWLFVPVNKLDSTNIQNTYLVGVENARIIWESAMAVGYVPQQEGVAA